MNKPVVISIGGSILVPEDDDVSGIRELASLLRSLAEVRRLFVVVGGGRHSRTYIRMGRKLGGREEFLDQMGISFTRLNAMLLQLALGQDVGVAETVEEAARNDSRIVIMGGTVPGHTTDAVSAMLAVKVGAELVVNATNVDGVYTADPKATPDAKQIPRMSFAELEAMVRDTEGKAGSHVPFDPKGVRLLKEHGIRLIITNGKSHHSLKKAVEGEPQGTVVE